MQRGKKNASLDRKILRGTRESRLNRREPVIEEPVTKPKFIKDDPKVNKIWDYFISIGIGRVLTRWDSMPFATFCMMQNVIEKWAKKPGDVPSVSFLAEYRRYAEVFGCVPAGRARLNDNPDNDPKNKDKKNSKKSGTQSEPGEVANISDYFGGPTD